MTLAEALRAVFDGYAGPFYVAANPTQRKRVMQDAGKMLHDIFTTQPEVLLAYRIRGFQTPTHDLKDASRSHAEVPARAGD